MTYRPMSDVCILLTATINVREDMPFVKRSDPEVRLADYKRALRSWLTDPSAPRLVICENSGADIRELKTLVQECSQPDRVAEFLTFEGQSSFSPYLGKGYGEMLALSYMLQNSKVLGDCDKFIKVTGRYYVRNIKTFTSYLGKHRDIDVMCNYSKNLSFSDSRCFGGSVSFLRQYLCPMRDCINDVEGTYFEHVLARAAHRALGDGRRWSLPPSVPDIVGISGTSGATFKTSIIGRAIRESRYRLKRFVVLR